MTLPAPNSNPPAETERKLVVAPPSVSIVLSFWNEEDNIPELLQRLRKVLGELKTAGEITGHEIIFVNDASTDRSELIIRNAAVGNDDIRLINMSRNFGVSPCVLAGMERAAGDVVIYLDADLQDPPELIPKLIAEYRSEPGVCVVHTMRTRREGESKLKLAITKLGYNILRRVSSIDLPMEAGDYKLLSRRVVSLLVQLKEKRPFLRGMVCWVGFKQKRVQYIREARFSGKTHFPVLGARVILNFLDSAVIAFSDVPLKFAMVAGALVSFVAMLYIIWIVIAHFLGLTPSGFAATNIALLLLGGIQLLCIGVLGLYVSSIFLETKWRPNFIVSDTFGFPDSKPENSSSAT